MKVRFMMLVYTQEETLAQCQEKCLELINDAVKELNTKNNQGLLYWPDELGPQVQCNIEEVCIEASRG